MKQWLKIFCVWLAAYLLVLAPTPLFGQNPIVGGKSTIGGKAVIGGTTSAGGGGSVSFDVAGAGTSSTGVSSLTAAHTVTNSITLAAVVALVGMASTSNDVTGCTFNGTAMTQMWDFRETQLGGYRTVGYILPVGTGDGVAHNAVCSFTNTNGETALITESYSGVNQSTPNRAAFTAALSGSGTNGCNIAGSVSLAVTNAVTGDIVIDLLSINHQTSLASSQTLVKSFLNIAGNSNSVLGSRASASGSTNMGYTFPTSPEQCGSIGAAAIRP